MIDDPIRWSALTEPERALLKAGYRRAKAILDSWDGIMDDYHKSSIDLDWKAGDLMDDKIKAAAKRKREGDCL